MIVKVMHNLAGKACNNTGYGIGCRIISNVFDIDIYEEPNSLNAYVVVQGASGADTLHLQDTGAIYVMNDSGKTISVHEP